MITFIQIFEESEFQINRKRDLAEFLQILKSISWQDLELKLTPGFSMTYDVRFKDKTIQTKYYNIMSVYTNAEFGSVDINHNKNNEIHWRQGLPEIYRGLNFGFKIYKAIINQFGFITSSTRSSDEIKQYVYKKLENDPNIKIEYKDKLIIVSKK